MNRIYFLVEGQTEEAFVRELLQPHYATMGLHITPIIASTRLGYKGGVVSYSKIKPQIEKLCKKDKKAYVSTLFDLYALPTDFPGKKDSVYSTFDDSILDSLIETRKSINPENINDGPQTAPSKRIKAVWSGYQKTFHGPLIACDIGLDAIRKSCPHFNQWLERLEKLLVILNDRKSNE
jgi:Domain of unknown function (DUF4276)